MTGVAERERVAVAARALLVGRIARILTKASERRAIGIPDGAASTSRGDLVAVGAPEVPARARHDRVAVALNGSLPSEPSRARGPGSDAGRRGPRRRVEGIRYGDLAHEPGGGAVVPHDLLAVDAAHRPGTVAARDEVDAARASVARRAARTARRAHLTDACALHAEARTEATRLFDAAGARGLARRFRGDSAIDRDAAARGELGAAGCSRAREEAPEERARRDRPPKGLIDPSWAAMGAAGDPRDERRFVVDARSAAARRRTERCARGARQEDDPRASSAARHGDRQHTRGKIAKSDSVATARAGAWP